MKWESIKTGQAHVDLVPSRPWTPVHLLLKCFPSWIRFSAFKSIYRRKQSLRMFVCLTYQRCCHASSTEPKGLLQEGSAAGKDVKADTRRKPGHGQEAQQECRVERSALPWTAISRRACSTAKSAPTQPTKNVPGSPGTNNLTIYCISPIPHHFSNLLKYFPGRLQRSATSSFLTQIAHSHSTWYFLTAAFPP